MKVVILGAGMAGLSLAYFLQISDQIDEIVLLEKESEPGGLCRSVRKSHYIYDIGPHIIFSKDQEVLSLMHSLLDGNENVLRRSNQILYKGRYIQYPFENDLSKLPQEDLNHCINAFENNPYESYSPTNMLQFFLKTFGEGITEAYLRPYNEKIWKFDLSYMSVQMVERIPKPTREEIRRSASGETVEGYLHQLYFSYPSAGGIGAVVNALLNRLNRKCRIILNYDVGYVSKQEERYLIADKKKESPEFLGDILISTMPVQELYSVYTKRNDAINDAVLSLKYNSIKVFLVKTKEDLCGNNFTFTIPDKNVIFHRISKMDFLGEKYCNGGASYIVEVTYRKNDHIDGMSVENLNKEIISGIERIGFARQAVDVEIIDMYDCPYAYVIYDLLHSENMKRIRSFFRQEGIYLTGRFGNFEYWNMDRVIREAKNLSQSILEKEIW